MRFLVDQLWHRLLRRQMTWVSADEINAEAGTMDHYCTCRLCKRLGRTNEVAAKS